MEKAAQWFDEGVDGEANDITVGWSPTNYTAAADNVLAHLQGINTRFGKQTLSTSNPTVNDDGTQGYSINSTWINTSGTGEVFRCIDITTGAAVWIKTTLTIDELGTAASANIEITTVPAMDGVASVGSAGTVSDSAHVHPSDTSKSDTGHTHSDATTSTAGFESAADKTKLDGIATSAAALATTGTPENLAAAAALGNGTTAAPINHVHSYSGLSLSGHTHTGSEVSNTPAGNLVSTDVQDALNELDTEKAKLAGGNTFTGLQIMQAAKGAVYKQIAFLASDRDGICAAQQLAGAGDLIINGAYAVDGVVDCSNGNQGPLATVGPVCARYVTLYSAGDLSGVAFTVYGLKVDTDGVVAAGSTVVAAGPNNETIGVTGEYVSVTRIAANGAVGADIEVGLNSSGYIFYPSPMYNMYCVTEPSQNWNIKLPTCLADAGYFTGTRIEVLKYSTAKTITWSALTGGTLVSEALTTGGNSKLMGYNIVARNPSGNALKLLASNAFAEP